MRRSEITISINKIISTLKNTDIEEYIMSLVRDKDMAKTSKLIAELNKFSIAYNSFSNEEKEIVNIMGLSDLTDIEKMVEAITSEDRAALHQYIWPLHHKIVFTKTELPRLLNLFKQSHQVTPEFEEVSDINQTNKSTITLILPEIHEQSSSPKRLAMAIEAMATIYSVFAKINDSSVSEITVIGIDSGSDKSFDFLGNSAVMANIKDLFLGIWDSIIYYREDKSGKKLDLLAKSLPIMEQISDLEKSKKLGPEEAEILRKNTIKCVNTFIDTGAITPEIESNNNFSPRELMAPAPKMLTTTIEVPIEIEEEKGTELNVSEEKELKRLLDKKKGKGKED